MLYALILFAQDETKKGEGGLFGGNNFMFLPIALMVLFFFVVILPQSRKRKKEQEELMTGMKKNDEVVTASGIIGIVHAIKEGADEVVLKIDDNARIRVLKSSIVRINKKEEAAAPPAPAADANAKPNG